MELLPDWIEFMTLALCCRYTLNLMEQFNSFYFPRHSQDQIQELCTSVWAGAEKKWELLV